MPWSEDRIVPRVSLTTQLARVEGTTDLFDPLSSTGVGRRWIAMLVLQAENSPV